MTVDQLKARLAALPPEAGNLPVFAVCGSSGVSYEVSFYGEAEKTRGTEEAGPLCELPAGTPIVRFSLG